MSAVLDAGQTSGLLSALQAIAALVLVAALVWLGRRGLSNAQRGRRRSESMHVEERIALDLKNALVIVRVGTRRLLVATGEHGPARLVAELTIHAADEPGSPAKLESESPATLEAEPL